MQTRIRHYRKQRGLTLQQLAELVATTPQTVSRLETGSMTVSIDWLEKFAQVLDVPVAALIESGRGRAIELLGTLSGDGAALAPDAGDTQEVMLEVPADRPVAVRLAAAIGRYDAGDLLIGNRLEGPDLAAVHGQDCIVPGGEDRVFLRRVVRAGNDTFTLVPLDPGGDVRLGVQLPWAARIVMRVSYYRDLH